MLGVDTSTLTGKVMCGYQGWFNARGDGSELGWAHWTKGRGGSFGLENVAVDPWLDMSEFGPGERYSSGFRNADGSVAEVFSSHDRLTVLRHFEWMREYGIDGAFVQRFANGLSRPEMKDHKDVVLKHAREGANRNGRAYAVMYDLSGLPEGGVDRAREDWIRLRTEMKITEDPAYLRHEGRPLVSVWGIGFSDRGKKRAFLWSQIEEAKALGSQMLYVAMFDEVDEGTAIFKCVNNPPSGDGVPFLDYEGLPSDYYLKLVGDAGRLLRDERSLKAGQPTG